MLCACCLLGFDSNFQDSWIESYVSAPVDLVDHPPLAIDSVGRCVGRPLI